VKLRKRTTYFRRGIFWEVCAAGSCCHVERVHFPLQIFRGGFNAEKYVDDKKLLFSAEHKRLKKERLYNSRMTRDEN